MVARLRVPALIIASVLATSLAAGARPSTHKRAISNGNRPPNDAWPTHRPNRRRSENGAADRRAPRFLFAFVAVDESNAVRPATATGIIRGQPE
jgi:hypothetical protein